VSFKQAVEQAWRWWSEHPRFPDDDEADED
jgi:hypothetical protein